MTRGAKFVLGFTVALVTAAGLQYSLGGRFHHTDFRNSGFAGCGPAWHQIHAPCVKIRKATVPAKAPNPVIVE